MRPTTATCSLQFSVWLILRCTQFLSCVFLSLQLTILTSTLLPNAFYFLQSVLLLPMFLVHATPLVAKPIYTTFLSFYTSFSCRAYFYSLTTSALTSVHIPPLLSTRYQFYIPFYLHPKNLWISVSALLIFIPRSSITFLHYSDLLSAVPLLVSNWTMSFLRWSNKLSPLTTSNKCAQSYLRDDL